MLPEVVDDRSRMKNVEELLKILLVANKLQEEQQIGILLHQMNEMEKGYAAALQELADIKSKLDEVLDRTENSANVFQGKSIFAKFSGQMTASVIKQKQNLQDIRQDLNAKAQNLMGSFKKEGVKALNNVSEFLGIQEKLIAMRDHARSSEMRMKDTIERIDAAEAELSGAATRLRNAGRIITGNEKTGTMEHGINNSTSKANAVIQMLKKHCVKWQNSYAKRAEKLDRAIDKFHALEQKSSVLGKLSDNKERLISEDKQLPAIESDHKRDENIR